MTMALLWTDHLYLTSDFIVTTQVKHLFIRVHETAVAVVPAEAALLTHVKELIQTPKLKEPRRRP